MADKLHKRVAIDFDGTLVDDSKDIEKDVKHWSLPKAKVGAAETTKWLKDNDFEILIFTCRPDYHRKFIEDALNSQDVSFDYIMFYTKPRVTLYIDDKGLKFDTWANVRKEVAKKFNLTNKVGEQIPEHPYEDALIKNKRQRFYFSKQERILDFGGGYGKVWKGEDLNIDLLDTDKKVCEVAERCGIYKRVFSNPSTVSNKDYETIVAFGILEHLDNPLTALLQFKSAKRICITVPNARSLHRYLGVRLGMLDKLEDLHQGDLEIGHKRVYTPESLKALLSEFCKQSGHSIAELGSVSLKIGNHDQMMPFVEIAAQLNDIAQDAGIVGSGKFYGAELYCELILENKNV
jgi:hydroxymethylpyrimidine pyrophosphatase-like HAD family hydrolase